jgi:hypothetical protein
MLTAQTAFPLQKEKLMPYDEVMDKFKNGKLHSGSPDGPKVKDKSQAVAIMLNEKKKAMAEKKEYQPGHGAASPSSGGMGERMRRIAGKK